LTADAAVGGACGLLPATPPILSSIYSTLDNDEEGRRRRGDGGGCGFDDGGGGRRSERVLFLTAK